MVSAATAASSAAPMSKPRPESAGAALLPHVPTWPGRLHCSSGASQASSQHTASTQNPVEHSDDVSQLPPCGMPVVVAVAVAVVVPVAVAVAVWVAVPLGESAGVEVLVPVDVAVAVAVAVGVSV